MLKVEVLDQGYVELLDVMPHPASGISMDLAVVNAARVSFLGESKGEEADKKLLFYMLRNGHTSPFEQVGFKFRVHAPLVTWWQWVRHRTASYNLQSGRYTEFDEEAVYIPKVWRMQSSSNKQGSEGFVANGISKFLSEELLEHCAAGYEKYKAALNAGVSREQARLFLSGFAVYYTGVISIDAHNLMHFLKLRMHPHAQEEIRVYAEAIYNNFFKKAMPWAAEAFEKYVLNEVKDV